MGVGRVLYIHPSKLPVDKPCDWSAGASPYLLAPMGVIGLANALRGHGVDVVGINYPSEVAIDPTFRLVPWLRQQPNVRLVMVDLHWYEHAYGAMDVVRACKHVWPDVPVLLGGLTATRFAEEIMANFAAVDYLLRGDPEAPAVELADGILGGGLRAERIANLSHRVDGQPVHNDRAYHAGLRELESLDFVDSSFFVGEERYARFQSSDFGRLSGQWLCVGRGCHMNCGFCGGSKKSHLALSGREAVLTRRPELVADDVARLAARGLGQVSLSHDPAVLGRPYWSRLFQAIQDRNVRIGLYNECWQLPGLDWVDALADTFVVADSQLAISPLSGDEEVRRLNGKHYPNERLMQFLSALERHRIPIFVYFSLNLPGETEATLERTIGLAAQIARAYPPELVTIANMLHTIDPESAFANEPERFGIEIQMRTFMHYYEYAYLTPYARPEARIGRVRGFDVTPPGSRSLARMAATWDAAAAELGPNCKSIPRIW
jgi:radical SAM superfamily enzyme YgiQ (UPF0313 family)